MLPENPERFQTWRGLPEALLLRIRCFAGVPALRQKKLSSWLRGLKLSLLALRCKFESGWHQSYPGHCAMISSTHSRSAFWCDVPCSSKMRRPNLWCTGSGDSKPALPLWGCGRNRLLYGVKQMHTVPCSEAGICLQQSVSEETRCNISAA